MENLLVYLQGIVTYLSLLNISNLSATASTSFLLIAAAEIGDKSQLVCMTLAARHRATPVLLGAIASFAFLNSLAVIFGVAIASWFPDYIVSITVAVLFAVFGVHSLSSNEEEEDEEVVEKSGHSLFFTTFFLITIAEFGDKTQLAVVALSSTAEPFAVWIGATSALILTSTLGVIAGRTLLKKIPLTLLHKVSGFIFLVLAVLAAYSSYLSFTSHP
jgi:putative Ca2+/H+ antiporter (TMEM165/GDT1 family)